MPQRHAAPEGQFGQSFQDRWKRMCCHPRKQNGFKDEIAFVGSDGAEAVSISMWDRKESADAYARDTYPAVLKSLNKVVQGTPKVDNYEVSNSTFHKIAAR
jgi:hypothetical protein